jgi:hypothetical protein
MNFIKFIKEHWYPSAMVSMLFVVMITLAIFHSCSKQEHEARKEAVEIIVTYSLEEAYFEGQKDVLEGDVRIEIQEDSSYVWIKSPWNSGRKPVFNPQEYQE